MKPSAVLLVDLENFFCSREDFCRNRGPAYDRARFRDDLEKLLGYARAMTADRVTGIELPFTVRRAYADYNAVRYVPGGAQHYLRALPEELLSQGIEPVQVFRLSRGGKNAADMRMAMDATGLLFTAGHVEHFVLVTGDADFIPVILELKRYGHTVSVIGVTNATSPKIQRFVDNFELFEDLLAAEEAEARSGKYAATGDALGLVAAAVQRLLARTHVLRFAAVKPLLSKELGHPFDPGLFGCDSTGDFLRDQQSALGIVIRQGPHDSEITLLGAPAPLTNGVRVAPPPRPPAKPAKAPDPEPHTAAHYRHLLLTPTGTPSDREGKVYAVPWSALVWLCDAVVPLLAPPTGEPTHSTKLQSKLIVATEKWAIPDLVKHVRLFYPTLRAGLPVQGADGVYTLPAETTAARVRHSVLGYILGLLKCRLTESSCVGDIRPDQLAAVFDPGPALDEATAEFTAALAEPAPQPPPRPVKLTPKPAAVVEELHTAAGYVKLLKVGGAKGSETEAFKVLPVPWPSVERICEDTFTLLCPGTGGAPLPRDQLTAKLIDAGKELYIEKYDQHVRRVLGVLRLAGDVSEENGLMTLNGAVTDGHNLRSRALGFLLELLRLRLEDRGAYDPIRPLAFAAALEAGPLTDRLIAEITPAIAWLYKPVDDEPAEVSPPIEVPAPVPEADPDAVPVGLEVDPGPAPTEPLVPEPVPAKPDWDAYSFDGVLPEIDTGNDPLPPEVRHEVEQPPAVMMSAPTALPTDPPSGVYRDVDIAEITSMAVAAAQGSGPTELDSDEIAFAPMVPESPSGRYAKSPSGRYVKPPSKTFTPEDLLAAVSPDGMPRDEPLFEEIYSAENPIVLADPEPVSLPPLPLFPPEEAEGRVDKMNPPPRRVVPPPLPGSPRQPPTESA